MAQQEQRALRSASKSSPRASRHAKPAASYREPSSELESELDIGEDLGDSANNTATRKQPDLPRSASKAIPRKRKRPRSPAQQIVRSVHAHLNRSKRKKPREQQTKSPNHPRSSIIPSKAHHDIYSAGLVPPWSSLPYEILLQIFQYASYPLYDDRTFEAYPSADWLVKTSRLCRAFTEPALTVIYRSPPLVPMDRAHKLRQLLMADLIPMTYNYKSKVERLQMEISQTAAYTLPGYGLLDFHGLVFNCPRLSDLELYHQADMSPYRNLDASIKWTYPDSLFAALNKNVTGNATTLRSWRWSSRLAGKRRPIESLLEIHRSQSFCGLQKIAFVNYQKQLPRKHLEDPQHEKMLANCLSALPLEHLIFESSTLVNSILLPLLPRNLKHLELVNCWEATSEDFATFLLSHGSQLRSLTLNHNQSLNLSFLTVLGDACPQLCTLKMNLTYYNVHIFYKDSEPQYERLLNVDEVPKWPPSLQTIELSQLRNWDVETAKMFFQSLLDSAATLANLRRLVIKAILSTSWRERSSFRDKWVGAFERVFKRTWIPPDLNLQSFGAFAAYKKRKDDRHRLQFEEKASDLLPRSSQSHHQIIDGDDSKNELLTKRSLRSADGRRSAPVRYSAESDSDSESGEMTHHNEEEDDVRAPRKQEEQLSNIRRSNRLIPLVSLSQSMVDEEKSAWQPIHGKADEMDDSDDEPLSKRIQTGREKKAQVIQGLCETVSITIDNLRPTENQFVEADFLDSEPEGDEDWDGREDVPRGSYYAW